MVKLDKIYTRGGDGGQTSLIDGKRVAKCTPRLMAMGDVDEANAILGLANTALGTKNKHLKNLIRKIQNDLCDLGADFACPGSSASDGKLRIKKYQVTSIETEIDFLNSKLKPLDSFILPGGERSAVWLHLARTVIRRAERSAVEFSENEPVNKFALAYLNRLSDLMFVMARQANNHGQSDELWEPGKYGGPN